MNQLDYKHVQFRCDMNPCCWVREHAVIGSTGHVLARGLSTDFELVHIVVCCTPNKGCLVSQVVSCVAPDRHTVLFKPRGCKLATSGIESTGHVWCTLSGAPNRSMACYINGQFFNR